METNSSSFPSSYSTTTRRKKYDVFLSFRGEDTRNNFMGHLYEALIQKGIVTFKDDEKLERGKPISPELSKAIEESIFAIVILSENYASSTWCLDELAKIIHCKNEMRMTVLPVFHYVDPSDVRKQWGTFAQAFAKHEEKENKERVEKWRDALRQVAKLHGWHLDDTWPEIEDIKDIVEWISLNLKYDAFPYIAKDLVGIYPRVMKLKSCLALESYDVRFIGIWAMGGMGKTTLARVVYNMISKNFEDCVFIEDVREKIEKYGVVPLQEKILEVLKQKHMKIQDTYDGVQKIYNRLCKKKILLVLDDVDKLKHLEMLAGEHDWFGSGSRIIITTRDKHVLEAHGVDEIYEVKGLCHEDSLQLFSLKAFKEKHVPNDYLELSNRFLSYAANLPLALEVLGSFLIGRSLDEWNSVLERLKQYPEEDIFQVLKISFDGLQKPQKEIFLHIACFFNHQKKDYVEEKLNILDLFPGIGLKELIDKSLLKIIYKDIVWMHDLLEEMGKNIVSQEYPNDPGKHSRLWRYEDIDKVLRKNKGTEAIQAMVIWDNYDNAQEAHWNSEAFSKMFNLKFLRMNDVAFVPTHLPNDLRILDWISYSSKSLPSSFQSDELVQLCLQKSRIEQLWIGIKKFDKLKFIDLTASLFLIITPDFTEVPNLEKLILERCVKLHKFHPSIGVLKKLIHLNLKGCERLNPPSCMFQSECLVALEPSNCSKLKKNPIFVGNMEFLQEPSLDRTAVVELIRNFPQNLWMVKGLGNLDLSYTAIEELPSSIEQLTKLNSLTLRYCINLVCLPRTICSLKLLNSLDLFGCLKFENLPENIGNMEGLELFNLCWTAIKEVPSSIVLLKNLKQLHIRGWKLSEFYSEPESSKWFTFLPTRPPTRRISLPSYIYSSLQTSPAPVGLSLPSLSGLQSLTDLYLSHCDLSSIPNDIGCLSSLNHLDLSGNNFVSLPESMSQLSNLQSLYLVGCKRLQSLENVPSTIVFIIAEDCISLERLPQLQFYRFRSDHTYLQFLFINCFKLVDNVNSILQGVNNMLQGQSGTLPEKFKIIIPGSEIPKYFNHECTGHELEVQVPSNRSNAPVGIAFCVVFVPYKLFEWPCDWELSFIINGFLNGGEISGSRKENGTIESHHLWLTYFSYQNAYHPVTIRALSWNLEVEKIGVRFIYRQDIENPSKTMAQCINNSSIVIHHDIDDSIAEDSRIKQSRDEDDDGAGPSGECSSNVEPPPKWIRRLGGFVADSEDSSQTEFFNFFAMEGKNQAAEKLDAIHESSSYQDIEDLNLTMAQNSNNSSTLYEGLAKTIMIMNDSATESSKNKQNCHEDDGTGPSGEGYFNVEPQPNWIYKVGEVMADCEESSQREIFDFFAMEREYEMSKMLESIHGGNRDSYQDIEDPNQIITQLSINSRALYEDLGDPHHDLNDSTLEDSRNKRSRDEDGGAGPSGEDYSSDKTPSKNLEDVWLILKNFVQGMFQLFCLRESKKLEAYCSGKREGYKSDGEELATEGPSSQTHLGTC